MIMAEINYKTARRKTIEACLDKEVTDFVNENRADYVFALPNVIERYTQFYLGICAGRGWKSNARLTLSWADLIR